MLEVIAELEEEGELLGDLNILAVQFEKEERVLFLKIKDPVDHDRDSMTGIGVVVIAVSKAEICDLSN